MTLQSKFLLLSATVYLTTACHSFMAPTNSETPNTTTNTPTPITSFEAIKAQILTPKCLHCHSTAKPEGDVDLSSYSAILANPGLVNPGQAATSRLFEEVESGGMPEDGPALNANEVQTIEDWINAGAPDGEFTSNTPAMD